MTLKELIEMGEKAANKCYNNYDEDGYYDGQEYQYWLCLATRYLEKFYLQDKETQIFRDLAENANGTGNEYFHKLIGILKALQQLPSMPKKTDTFSIIQNICTNYNKSDSILDVGIVGGLLSRLMMNMMFKIHFYPF